MTAVVLADDIPLQNAKTALHHCKAVIGTGVLSSHRYSFKTVWRCCGTAMAALHYFIAGLVSVPLVGFVMFPTPTCSRNRCRPLAIAPKIRMV